jgi:hypothetical protein
MPKQRNHPHHHRRSRSGPGLQLPQIFRAPITGLPNIIYPRGWIFPRSRIKRVVYSPLDMGLALLALIILAVALARLLAGM